MDDCQCFINNLAQTCSLMGNSLGAIPLSFVFTRGFYIDFVTHYCPTHIYDHLYLSNVCTNVILLNNVLYMEQSDKNLYYKGQLTSS